MTKDKEGVGISSSIFTSDGSSIKKIEREDKFTITRTSSHNEISIMESDWLMIKKKVYSLSFQKGIDITGILLGAMIPYIFDVFNAYIKGTSPNYFPIVICIVLIVGSKYLSKRVPIFSEDKTDINLVHLDDIKDILTRVDAESTHT